MKAYTDIKQSAQLAILLPKESADMWWSKNFIYYNPTASIGIGTEYNTVYTHKFGEDDIPCWSASALLEIIRNNGRYELQMYEGGYYFEANGFMTESYFNAVDACYEMILKLKEKDLL